MVQGIRYDPHMQLSYVRYGRYCVERERPRKSVHITLVLPV